MAQAWMKFYPQDHAGDTQLAACSMAARGLWFDLLCAMSEAEPRGSLLGPDGGPATARDVAALARATMAEVEPLLAELEAAGVCERDATGALASRRMRRDVAQAAIDAANGRRGGNPRLRLVEAVETPFESSFFGSSVRAPARDCAREGWAGLPEASVEVGEALEGGVNPPLGDPVGHQDMGGVNPRLKAQKLEREGRKGRKTGSSFFPVSLPVHPLVGLAPTDATEGPPPASPDVEAGVGSGRRSRIALDAQPTQRDRQRASDVGMDMPTFRAEWARFRTYHQGDPEKARKATLALDWEGSWRTWTRRWEARDPSARNRGGALEGHAPERVHSLLAQT